MFGLESRLVYSSNQITEELLQSTIDFGKVNRIHESEYLKASRFLLDALK